MVNKVILIGNLGADPESRTTNSGMAVTNLRLATTTRHKNQEGEWTDQTEWHRVVCFGRTAENTARFLRKGRQVFVEGRIRTNKWQDRDGNTRYTTEVIANEVRFLGSRDGAGAGAGAGGGGSQGGGEYRSAPSNAGYNDSYGGGGSSNDGADDDIPF